MTNTIPVVTLYSGEQERLWDWVYPGLYLNKPIVGLSIFGLALGFWSLVLHYHLIRPKVISHYLTQSNDIWVSLLVSSVVVDLGVVVKEKRLVVFAFPAGFPMGCKAVSCWGAHQTLQSWQHQHCNGMSAMCMQ